MTYAVSISPYGRAGSGAINPLRAAAPDRKPPGPLNQEERPAVEEQPSQDRKENRARELAGSLARLAADRPGPKPNAAPEKESGDTTQKSPIDHQREEIRKLEVIRANALYPAPASAEERSVAQLAHTQIIRAQADIRASEYAAFREKANRENAAKFIAAQAAAAYRQLDEPTEGFAPVPYSK